VRMFRIYLSHGVAWMKYGDNELYQVVITPGIDNERPLTRDYMYEAGSNGANRTASSQSSREPVAQNA
ncbi:MAG: hypothetical protein AAB368_03905, partial [bacterium]